MNDHIDGLAEEQNNDTYEGKHRTDEPEQTSEQPKMFEESYVKELRDENKRYRLRANEADALAQRVHTLLVEKDGRLQDPTDLPFNPEHLEDQEALDAAISSLLDAKPHLKARRATGDIGAGNRGAAEEPQPFDLISYMRNA